MSSNKDILNKLVSNHKSKWFEDINQREANEDWLENSFKIAIKILRELRLYSMSQKELAEKMEVSPQYINKVVKGYENLSLETISKFENVLGIKLINILSFERSLELDIDYGIIFGRVDRNKSNSIVKEKISETSYCNYSQDHSLENRKTG